MVTWLHGPIALEQLGDRFDALVDDVGLPLVARRTWLQTWSDTYRDFVPWIAAVDGPDGRLDACALLTRRVRGGILDVTSMGRGQTDYMYLPARSEAAGMQLAEGIAARLTGVRRPWRLRVDQLPENDPVAAAVAARLDVAVIEPAEASPVVELRPGASPERHMTAGLRQTVRTARNRLARDGRKAEYVHEISPAGIGAFLPEVEAVWRARDRAVGRRSEADDAGGLGFVLATVRRLANRAEVELDVLLIDGRMAAFAVSLLDGPSCRVWVARIAPEFAVYSPGHLVTRLLLARAIERGCTELDWMRGEEPYKLATATTLRRHEHLTAWSSPLLRTMTEGTKSLRRKLLARREERARAASR